MGRAIIYSELQLDEDVSSASGAYFSVAFTILASIVLPTLGKGKGKGEGKLSLFERIMKTFHKPIQYFRYAN